VLVVAAKRQPLVLFRVGAVAPAAVAAGKALDRSGEVGGTSPPRSLGQIESPRYPTEPHFATQSGRKWDTIRRTELLRP
jgi:hypothetical protein